MVDGKWTVLHVWESREACDRFREGRLFPAIQKVSAMDPASGPQVTITEYAVHNYEKP
jgi:heme-degrading monooxygenase HmoA